MKILLHMKSFVNPMIIYTEMFHRKLFCLLGYFIAVHRICSQCILAKYILEILRTPFMVYMCSFTCIFQAITSIYVCS